MLSLWINRVLSCTFYRKIHVTTSSSWRTFLSAVTIPRTTSRSNRFKHCYRKEERTTQIWMYLFLQCSVNEGLCYATLDISGLSPSTQRIKDLLAMYLCQNTPPSLWQSLWGEFYYSFDSFRFFYFSSFMWIYNWVLSEYDLGHSLVSLVYN